MTYYRKSQTGLFVGTMIALLLMGCDGNTEVSESNASAIPGQQSTVADNEPSNSFAGFWKPTQHIAELKTLKGETPPLLPDALALYQERKTSETDGIPKWNNEHNCLPIGLTRLMANSPFELVVSDENLAVLFEWNRLVQLIPIAKAHEKLTYPFYLGNSIASFDQGAWIIDSVYFSDTTILDEKGMPHSEALHLTQELHLENDNTLVNKLTIEDPNVFTDPWQTQLTYSRMGAGEQLDEDVCVERLGLKQLDTTK